MNQHDKDLRSTLRVLKAAGVRKFQSGNITVEFDPNAGTQDEQEAPAPQLTNLTERFKEFDPNSKEDLDVLLGTR